MKQKRIIDKLGFRVFVITFPAGIIVNAVHMAIGGDNLGGIYFLLIFLAIESLYKSELK